MFPCRQAFPISTAAVIEFMFKGPDQEFSVSNPALQNISNHHPLANGQGTLPSRRSSSDNTWTPNRTTIKSPIGDVHEASIDTSDNDIENYSRHRPRAIGRSIPPRGRSSTRKYIPPIRDSSKRYITPRTRIKDLDVDVRCETLKSHGDLSNLRPKSPPLSNIFTAPRIEHTNYQDSGTTGSNKVAQITGPSPLKICRFETDKIHNRPYPHDGMSTVLNDPHISEDVLDNVKKDRYRDTPDVSQSRDASYHVEKPFPRIPIHGLDGGISRPLDFCIPAIRSHPDSKDRNSALLYDKADMIPLVEQISTTNTWHGIQWSGAAELSRIHSAFIETLERILICELNNISVHMLQSQSMNITLVRGISFCREQLVSELAEALYSSKQVRASYSWYNLPLPIQINHKIQAPVFQIERLELPLLLVNMT